VQNTVVAFGAVSGLPLEGVSWNFTCRTSHACT